MIVGFLVTIDFLNNVWYQINNRFLTIHILENFVKFDYERYKN